MIGSLGRAPAGLGDARATGNPTTPPSSHRRNPLLNQAGSGREPIWSIAAFPFEPTRVNRLGTHDCHHHTKNQVGQGQSSRNLIRCCIHSKRASEVADSATSPSKALPAPFTFPPVFCTSLEKACLGFCIGNLPPPVTSPHWYLLSIAMLLRICRLNVLSYLLKATVSVQKRRKQTLRG